MPNAGKLSLNMGRQRTEVADDQEGKKNQRTIVGSFEEPAKTVVGYVVI